MRRSGLTANTDGAPAAGISARGVSAPAPIPKLAILSSSCRPTYSTSGMSLLPGWAVTGSSARSLLDGKSVQPVLLLELPGQVRLGEIAEVLVGQRVELVLEADREHPLDLVLPGLFLKPAVPEQLPRPAEILVVELDPDVARQAVAVGVAAGEADELGLGNGHSLALERQVDRSLLDHRVDVVPPRIVVDEHVHGKLVLLVQPPGQAPDAPGRLPVAGQEHAVVAPPELVFRQAV